MPVYQKLLNFGEVFSSLSEVPIIINDLAYIFESDKKAVQDMIITRFTSDMFDVMPSCSCGEKKGIFSSGVKCNNCGTVVQSSILSDVEPTVWFRKPVGVSKLINLKVLSMLRSRFTKSGFDIIRWIIDTSYRPRVKQPPALAKIQESNIQRGYNNFVDNFDSIIEYLLSIKDFKSKTEVDYLKELLVRDRNSIFSDYIPLPNKSMFIVDKTDLGVFVDPNIADAVDAIEMLISIDKNFYDQNPKVKESRTARALLKLCEFYETYIKKSICPKTGILRKHLFGSRTNFSFRAVISSITDPHEYDEIHVPWGIGLSAFKPHLMNKLIKMGMDVNSAEGLILGHINKYHPLLDKFLEELIDETPKKRIPIILQRN